MADGVCARGSWDPLNSRDGRGPPSVAGLCGRLRVGAGLALPGRPALPGPASLRTATLPAPLFRTASASTCLPPPNRIPPAKAVGRGWCGRQRRRGHTSSRPRLAACALARPAHPPCTLFTSQKLHLPLLITIESPRKNATAALRPVVSTSRAAARRPTRRRRLPRQHTPTPRPHQTPFHRSSPHAVTLR